jgi:glucose-6-phosphate isomerase
METYTVIKSGLLSTLRACILILAMCPGHGCAHKKVRSSSFKEQLKMISATLGNLDAEGYCTLLSEKQKIGVKKEDVQKSMESNKKEFKNLAAMLAGPEKVVLEAKVSYGGNDILALVMEGEQWKIQEGIVSTGRTPTPGDACVELLKKFLALRAAIQQAAVLDEAYRSGLVGSLDKAIEELTNMNTQSIVIADDRAFIVLPSGRRIEFMLEGDQWKVTRIFPMPIQ